LLKHFLTLQFVGFLAVGCTAASINWASRYAMSTWVPFYWAVLLAYLIGMFTAFVLNRIFVFPTSSVPIRAQVSRFVIINIAFIPLVWGGALLLVDLLELLGARTHVEEVAHAIALSLPMLVTFLLYKFFAFSNEDDS
jgi:putative flippase GtrA